VPHKYFIETSADIISKLLSRNNKGLILTFDYRTRELCDELKYLGADVTKLYFLDAVSYANGKGSPPVQNLVSLNQTDDFENMTYYSLIQLRIMNTLSMFVVVVAPYELLNFSDYDDIGMFFEVFSQSLERKGIPLIIIYEENQDPILMRMLKDTVIKQELELEKDNS
jgi:hypothetical protein